MAGTKRASPGDEDEKSYPISDVILTEEDAAKLTQVRKDLQRAEVILGALLLSLFANGML